MNRKSQSILLTMFFLVRFSCAAAADFDKWPACWLVQDAQVGGRRSSQEIGSQFGISRTSMHVISAGDCSELIWFQASVSEQGDGTLLVDYSVPGNDSLRVQLSISHNKGDYIGVLRHATSLRVNGKNLSLEDSKVVSPLQLKLLPIPTKEFNTRILLLNDQKGRDMANRTFRSVRSKVSDTEKINGENLLGGGKEKSNEKSNGSNLLSE
tara:strand:- start:1349 stop:1978 length:630 start_codon:yes stop_codon:yes gene_type:complete